MAEEVLWPLRAVSKDPTNLTKLDADGNVLTSSTDVDARYVLKDGDTMTGQLVVRPAVGPASPDGSIQVIGDDTNAHFTVQRNADANGNPAYRFKRSRGTAAAPTSVQINDFLGAIGWHAVRAEGTYVAAGSIIAACTGNPLAGDASIRTELRFLVGSGAAQAQVMVLRPDYFNVSTTAFSIGTDGYIISEAGVYTKRKTNGASGRFETKTGSSALNGIGVWAESSGVALKNYGIQVYAYGGTANTAVYISDELTRAPDNYAIESQSTADSYIRGNFGINILVPTHYLEVGGDTMLRGPLEVTGNITSAGTAHSFANSSIPSPAVIGNIPRTIAATGSAGSAGQMVWDDNFIYLRTTAGWKKVALTAI
jgi:hypothetical protein